MPYASRNNWTLDKDPNAKLWRYLDFVKFVSMLDTHSLYFARADKFLDPFEGIWTKPTHAFWKRSHPQVSDAHIRDMFATFEQFRQYCYLNCWYANEHESAAMWDLYSSRDAGVAIQSTYEKLARSFNADRRFICIGKVKYLDYEKDVMPGNDPLAAFLCKRKSFEHEREVRALVDQTDEWCNSNNPQEPLPGLTVNCNLSVLIDRIYVSPLSPPWFEQLVRSVLKKYQIAVDVVHSALYSAPLY